MENPALFVAFEFILIFGGILAACFWQLGHLKRLKREREAKEALEKREA